VHQAQLTNQFSLGGLNDMNRKRLCGWLAASFATATFAMSTNTFASTKAETDQPVTLHPTNFTGIVGTNRDDADKKMGKLGFKMKKDANEDRGSLWWNGTTKECVELIGKNGRVKSIEPAASSKCH
jgi:hypothetical protein